MNEDHELFGEIGAKDQVRRPERWNTKQWLAAITGLGLMALGGILAVVAFALHAAGEIVIVYGIPGACVCTLGYWIYRKHWDLRDRQ